jgi:hypothetical protein
MHVFRLLRCFTLRALPVAGLLLFMACNKTDFDDARFTERTAEYAFPLFNTTLTLKDLMFNILNDSLSSDTLLVNPDNTMTLIYTGDVAEKPATDIFKFLSTGILPVQDTLYYAPFQAPAGVSITKAVLNGGTLKLLVANPQPKAITGNFYIPQMTLGGKQLVIPFSVPANTLLPLVLPGVDLKGRLLESNNNTIFFRYEAYLPDGGRIRIPDITKGAPAVFMSFENMTFAYLQGYWGYSENPLTRDTIEIDINQTNLEGGVKLKNPKVTMTVANSWGFPTRGVVRYLSFIGKNGQEYPLKSTAFNVDSVDFAWPSFVKGEVGKTKYTSIRFDETNSNIAEIFNAEPTRMIYDVYGIANAQKDTAVIGFLTDSSNIKLGVKVELLLEGSAKNFRSDQTLELDFADFAEVDTAKIEAVEFKLVTENKTPISTALQLYFRDARGTVVDSLFTGGPKFIMEAAPVNASGVVNGEKRTENFIPMDVRRFDRVRTAKTALLETSFTTAQNGAVPVKLLATNQAVVKMGIRVKTKLKPKE